jgi:hypothetical protein
MQLPIPKFKVLLYGPGIPSSGVKARAHFEASVLVIEGKGHWFTIQGENLSLKTGGFDGRQWLLCWETPAGPVSVMLQGDDAVELFIKLAPPEIAHKLKQVHLEHSGQARFRRSWIALLILLVLLLAVIVFDLFSLQMPFSISW